MRNILEHIKALKGVAKVSKWIDQPRYNITFDPRYDAGDVERAIEAIITG